jgi:hypothetical protein
MLNAVHHWVDRNVLELGRELRLTYVPPLMVYVAAGISGLTGIVGTFFVKDYLGLSAEFLAALGFWAGIPWSLKMPLGHLVDLIWRWKAGLVFLGAGLIAASLGIMIGLIGYTELMRQLMPVEAWFVLSTLLAPVGYVVQDVVADAMTVEAVPRVDLEGRAYPAQTVKLMHTTMQTLGRVAIISGTVAVAAVNLFMFEGVEALPESAKVQIYQQIYTLALIIPAISVLGVVLASVLRIRDVRRLQRKGFSRAHAHELLEVHSEAPAPNWWILGGSLVFVAFTLAMGLLEVPWNQEIIFGGSLGIILFLMNRLVSALEPQARYVLVGTAVVVFVFRAVPTPGAGSTWWMIDRLGFDQHFLSELLSLPIVGMYYGLHHWTAAHTGGVVDAHFIALVDTALESPLGQIAMIPMLAWIANSAPARLKATFFAVMASFTNLALSLSQLGTKYLNQIFIVTREVTDRATGTVSVPADYSELGMLLITVTTLNFVLPMGAILIVKLTRFRTA